MLRADSLLTGGDVDPSAFLRVYNNNLEDVEPLFHVDEDSQMGERGDDDGSDDDDGDGGQPGETISTREIEAQVRKAAREKVKFSVFERRNDERKLTRLIPRNTTRSARSTLRTPAIWMGIRTMTSLPCAPAKLQRGLPK